MPKLSNDPFRIYMKSKYVFSLWRAGARVRWISPENTDANRSALLACDGLLMPGGVDIEPSRYGQETDEKCGKIDLARDAMEWWILETFLPTGKPVLGICRGIQMLNVFLGGTLRQHIDGHSDFKSRGTGFHKVRVTPGSRLREIVNAETLTVNSLHHQVVDSLGKNLEVCAVSEDGFVEAVVHRSHPFCLGVQWHPEHMSRTNKRQQKIFDTFVNACK
jgi:putative glutamine amidotransferase